MSRATVIAGGAAFAVLAGAIAVRNDPLPGDRRVLLALHEPLGTSLEDPLIRLADLTDLPGLAVLAIGVGLWLAWHRRWLDLVSAGAVVAVVWAANPVLKDLFARPRPDLWPHPLPVSEHSFPSGHAANSAALALAVILVTWERTGPRSTATRCAVVVIGSAAVAVVGLGQLALGVHFPSDVLAGWLLAATCTAAVWSIRSTRHPVRGYEHGP